MNWIIFYLLGVLISGVFISTLFRIDSYYDRYINGVITTKKQIKDEKEMSDEEKFILDSVDEMHVIKVYVYLIAFLSWIGILMTLSDLVLWIWAEYSQK